jgi:endonuclease/exonuclease/phosphatase family metal-dependent hydrolase
VSQIPHRAIARFRLIASILFVASLAPAAASRAEPAGIELKVMSFNIRYSYGGLDEEKTENNWTDPKHPRRERVVRVIREYGPDVLGVQEARQPQIVDLREALPQYDFYGVGRDDGKTGGEFAGVFYRKDRFAQVGAGSFWLSATPEKPGTSFYLANDAVPRMASWVRLRDKRSASELVVLNTHWDHISAPARQESAKLIRDRLRSLADDVPAIVMGDLNGPEDSSEVIELLGAADRTGPRLLDSYRELNPHRSAEEATFNGWAGTTAGSRIDFILHTRAFTPTAAEILRTNYGGRWPSDHYPVTATLRLSRRQSPNP